jgi:hypothetical protein
MKLYAEYLKETSGRECVYTDSYFYTYIIKNEVVHLEEVYISKEKRNTGLIDKIVEDVYKLGKDNNCKYITSSACVHTFKKVVERTDHILRRNGFVIYDEDNYMIKYVREIK